MNKKTLTILAALVAGSTFATEYHWKGNGPNTPAGRQGRAWNDVSNWTTADGSAVSDYPRLAGDKAVFHGLAQGEGVVINDSDVIVLDELRFEEGHSLLVVGVNASVHVTTMVISDHATWSYAPNDYSDQWHSPNDFIVGNAAGLAVTATGTARGCLVHRNWSDSTFETKGYLTFDENGKLVAHSAPETGFIWIDKDTVNENGCVGFGSWNSLDDIRGIHYNFYNDMSKEITYTGTSGMFVFHDPYVVIGKYEDQKQGHVSAGEESSIYFWPKFSTSTHGTNYIRSKVESSHFVKAGHGDLCIWDDHSGETCDYKVVTGGLILGGPITSHRVDNIIDVTCKLGTGSIDVGWDAFLDVASANSLNANSTINVRSYNGKKADFGTIKMTNNGTVNKLQIDGADLDAGTYGATGSGAANIRDDIFTGTGVLTVTNGTYIPPDDPPVTETKPLVIYFN